MGRRGEGGDVYDVDVVLHDVDCLCGRMRKITKAMTIPTVIAMTMPMLLLVALVVTLRLRRHQYKNTRAFLGFSDKNFATSRVTSPSNQQKEDEQHGICDTFAKTSPKSKNKLLWNKISETSSC